MTLPIRQFTLAIIGGGPAGIAPLLAAHRMGHLSSLLAEGVAIIERGPFLGGGSIGSYSINSDSSGTTFVDCLRSPERTSLTELAGHPLTRVIAAARDGAVALRDAGRFLDLVGRTLGDMITAERCCEVLTGHDALAVQQTSNGWRITVRDAAGAQRVLWARNVVLATGASQPSGCRRRRSAG